MTAACHLYDFQDARDTRHEERRFLRRSFLILSGSDGSPSLVKVKDEILHFLLFTPPLRRRNAVMNEQGTRTQKTMALLFEAIFRRQRTSRLGAKKTMQSRVVERQSETPITVVGSVMYAIFALMGVG